MKINKLLHSRVHNPPNPEAETLEIHPVFYRLQNKKDEEALAALLSEHPCLKVTDTIGSQVKELLKIQNPSIRFEPPSLDNAVKRHLNATPEWAYGVWVYYPWNRKLVHLLDEEEFVALRTNRNLYKITPEEKKALSAKRIGVIGLSVGQSVALTLAMERSFGELRIADFDTLDLSNLNRLRTGLSNLGLPKTVIVAREIAEIDPFLQVKCFFDGISKDNIDKFLGKDQPLDLLIDECDSLDIKILCRERARSLRIPVLMDTSDRGMIDIERFDLEQERPILHGLMGGSFSEAELRDPEARLQLSLQIAGGRAISERMKRSLPEIGRSISTWPQLASAVMLGGAAVAELSRKVLLGESTPSGRFYLDIEDIVNQ